MLLTSLHSLSLNILTPAHFISSTTLMTSLFFTFNCSTFSNKSTSSTTISTIFVLLTSSYSGFTNILFLLSFFTPTSQSDLLLKLSVFSILLPRTCFNVKSNLDMYNAHLACLQFNFCTFIKYMRFL